MQSNKVKVKNDIKRRCYIVALETISYIDNLNKKDTTVQILVKQLLRSTTSIGANVVEAQAGSSKKDFTNFMTHALKSANETKFWLGLLRDSHKADRDNTNVLLTEINELSKILAASILTLKGKR